MKTSALRVSCKGFLSVIEWEAIMKKEYDFTDAEQGRFYTKPEDMVIPHYLKPSLEQALREYSLKKGKTVDEILDAIVEKELSLLQKIG